MLMKKALSLVLPIFIFLSTLLYLHQKIQIYIEAYRLSRNFCYHNELLDKRDYLLVNFANQVSLNKVNQWVQIQQFTPVEKERIVAFNLKKQEQVHKGRLLTLLGNFLRTSTPTSTALAEEKR